MRIPDFDNTSSRAPTAWKQIQSNKHMHIMSAHIVASDQNFRKLILRGILRQAKLRNSNHLLAYASLLEIRPHERQIIVQR